MTQKTYGHALSDFTKKFVESRQAAPATDQWSNDLPCEIKAFPYAKDGKTNTSVVLVKFDSALALPDVEMPVCCPKGVYLPLIVGDLGLAKCMVGDHYLGGVSGIGGKGKADTKASNLGAMQFMPLGNTEYDKILNEAMGIYSFFMDIADREHKTNPTMLRENGILIVDKINEIVTILNKHTGSSIAALDARLANKIKP